MSIAIIPARGGSKRIPRKNIREFCGKPVIAWSIAAARDAGCFDRVIVSTDDEEIADVATRFGAEAPFRRPAELSDDFTPTVPVIAHAIGIVAGAGPLPVLTCCIYPTAPMVSSSDIRSGLALMRGAAWDYCISVTTFPYSVQRALRRDAHGAVSLMSPEMLQVRSQDLEPAFHDAGQFCWGRSQAWLEAQPVFGPRTASIVLPRYRVQDIDTEEDWQRAERLFLAR